ncbi:DNA-binding CsgD family transcriptional regulator [Rhizobium sp. PP-CC-2G-626]|nr:DNA-binding CsgD family transcriptional regulator [Rhizobium sp. PP-CC-2G-626]
MNLRVVSESEIIDQFYEAAVIPELWETACVALSQIVDASTAAVFAIDPQGTHRYVCSPNIREGVEYFSKHPLRLENIRPIRALERMPSTFCRDIELMTPEEFAEDRVLREVINRFGNQWVVGAVTQEPTGHLIMFDIQRKIGSEHFSDGEVARLNRLKPDLVRSVYLASRLAFSEAKTITSTLSALGLPAAVLGGDGRVIAMNEDFDGLEPRIRTVARDRLFVGNNSVQTLLADALARLAVMVKPTVQSIAVPSEEGLAPLILHLLPVRRAARDIFSRSLAILVVTGVGIAGPPDMRVLSGLFDLTPAEVKVARALLAGLSTSKIALENGVVVETARSQIKSILRKTGTQRQSELVVLLTGIAGPFRVMPEADS